MTEDYNKPLKRIIEIDGITDEMEKRMADDILFKIYDLAAKFVNNGGIDKFNSRWKDEHPNWVYTGSVEDEYYKAYERFFKSVADNISDKIKSPYKLRESEPCLINFKEGWFKIYGYKETNQN